MKSINIKGKDYIPVVERVKEFRKHHPKFQLATELLSNENGVCVFKASIYTDEGLLLATGHAYEKESSSFINKTSYIENAETSAIGRALGNMGIGIEDTYASADEVANAILNQNSIPTTIANEQDLLDKHTLSAKQFKAILERFNRGETDLFKKYIDNGYVFTSHQLETIKIAEGQLQKGRITA